MSFHSQIGVCPLWRDTLEPQIQCMEYQAAGFVELCLFELQVLVPS